MVGPADSLLQGDVAGREDVEPALAEHQIGLGGPAPDAGQGGERHDRRVVVQAAQDREIQPSLRLGLRQAPEIARLPAGQAEGLQGFGGRREQGLGGDPAETRFQLRQMASAEAVDTCCPTMILARPWRPPGLRPPFEGGRGGDQRRQGRIRRRQASQASISAASVGGT